MPDNTRYPLEILDEDADDGIMPDNVDQLAAAVVGHRIVSTEKVMAKKYPHSPHTSDHTYKVEVLEITLDNGKKVQLRNTDDCCAYTELEEFLLYPQSVDHIIMGIGTTDSYETWHIFADFGDILKLTVGWSCGNPFYYGYGFSIDVIEPKYEVDPKPHLSLTSESFLGDIKKF